MGRWEVHSAGAAGPSDGVLLAVQGSYFTKARVHFEGRIPEVTGTFGDCPVVFFTCYAPGHYLPEPERQAFWTALGRAVGQVARRYQVVLLGDFNAHVGPGRSNYWVGDHGCHSVELQWRGPF